MNNSKSANTSAVVDFDDFKIYGRIFLRNWYLIFILPVVAYFAAVLYSYKLVDVYAASTQILLKSNDQYNPSSIITDGGGFNYKGYVDNTNETRVIKSYDLIKEAINRLDLGVSYFVVGRVKTEEMFESPPFSLEVFSMNPILYEQMMRFRVLNMNEFEVTYRKGSLDITKKGRFDKEFIDTDFRFLFKNRGKITKETISLIKETEYKVQIHNKDNLIRKFQSGLSVTNPEFTNILQVTVEDFVPARAVLFLDTLSKVYIENSIKTRYDINANTIKYIERQMDEVTLVLNGIEDTMQDFKESRAILDINREQEDYFNKLSNFDGQKSGLVLQLQTLDDLEAYIIEDKDPTFLPPSIYVLANDGFLSKSTTELYSMQLSKIQALSNSKEGNFVIGDLDRRIERLKGNMLTYISNLRGAINERIADFDDQIKHYIESIRTIPKKQRDLVNIQRKLNVNEKMYIFLLEKRANTVIAKAGIIPETRIIEAARSRGVIRPDKSRLIYSFVGVGLVLSLLIIFIKDILFMKIENVEQLKKLTNLPMFGEIIYSDKAKQSYVVVDSDPKSLITESFRGVRTNLEYLASDVKSKTVLITSYNPGEGKTFCSINLASILAKAGKKVLILELDLHKPRVQIGLNMQSEIGVSTILIGKSQVKETVLKTTIDNLDVILSGPTPPNASELILSDNMKILFDYGRENYDYIVVDSAPMGLISDAMILMKYVDAVLFVMNVKFATKSFVKNVEEIIKKSKEMNIGLILNGVKQKRSRYYYNRYGYGYGYGYGYDGYSSKK